MSRTKKKANTKIKYVLDFSKIKTVKDILIVIRSLNPIYTWIGDPPASFEEIYDKGFLTEVKK